MNPPTVGGKFAAKDVGGGVPDAPGGVKTPPYDAKDKGDTMARLRACLLYTSQFVLPRLGQVALDALLYLSVLQLPP